MQTVSTIGLDIVFRTHCPHEDQAAPPPLGERLNATWCCGISGAALETTRPMLRSLVAEASRPMKSSRETSSTTTRCSTP
jgi:hypothetical protein